jgi:hypothetical protein
MLTRLTGLLNNGAPFRSGVSRDPRVTIEIPQGTDLEIQMRVVTPDGQAVPLDESGTELLLTIRKRSNQDWPRIIKAASVSGTTGTFLIEPGDTHDWAPGQYAYDVWLTRNGARDAVISTSTFRVTASVAATPVRPPPSTLSLVENDTEPLILDFSGVDISLWTITVHLAYSPAPLVKTAVIVDGPNGLAQVSWAPGDLIPGVWGGEVQVIKPGPVTQTSDVFIADIRAEIA